MSSIIFFMSQSFRRNVSSLTRLINYNVLFFHPPKYALRKSNSHLFQSLLLRNSTSSSNQQAFLYKVEKAVKRRLPIVLFVILGRLIVFGIISYIPVDLTYAWYRNASNEFLLNETVEKGTRPKTNISNKELISRPEVVKLMKMFQPDEHQSSYHMVCGKHGTGKTTLIRIAANQVGQQNNEQDSIIYVDIPLNFSELGEPLTRITSREQDGKGIIYVNIPPDLVFFGNAFGKAINFTFEEHISLTGQLFQKLLGTTKDKYTKSEDDKWRKAMIAFKRASEVYKAKYNKPPIIIYDNVNYLVHENPKILDILQDDAKQSADDRKYIAVFVTNEESVPKRMESRSSWSRASKSIMEIGDLNKEISMEYLINKRKINEIDAEKIYGLVGGRIVDLKMAANDIIAGESFEAIKQRVLNVIEKNFRAAQLCEDQQLYKAGKHIINILLNSKELAYIDYRKAFKSIAETKEFDPDKMLEMDIFAYHPEKNTVTFQSQSVKYYIMKNLNKFKS